MTKSDLIKRLEKIDGDPVVIIKDSFGWCNIDKVGMEDSLCVIFKEDYTGIFTSDKE